MPWSGRIALDIDTRELPEGVQAVAVSDDAGSVLLMSARAVYLLERGGSPRVVLTIANTASLAFFPNSADGVIAERNGGSIYVLLTLVELWGFGSHKINYLHRNSEPVQSIHAASDTNIEHATS